MISGLGVIIFGHFNIFGERLQSFPSLTNIGKLLHVIERNQKNFNTSTDADIALNIRFKLWLAHWTYFALNLAYNHYMTHSLQLLLYNSDGQFYLDPDQSFESSSKFLKYYCQMIVCYSKSWNTLLHSRFVGTSVMAILNVNMSNN